MSIRVAAAIWRKFGSRGPIENVELICEAQCSAWTIRKVREAENKSQLRV